MSHHEPMIAYASREPPCFNFVWPLFVGEFRVTL